MDFKILLFLGSLSIAMDENSILHLIKEKYLNSIKIYTYSFNCCLYEFADVLGFRLRCNNNDSGINIPELRYMPLHKKIPFFNKNNDVLKDHKHKFYPITSSTDRVLEISQNKNTVSITRYHPLNLVKLRTVKREIKNITIDVFDEMLESILHYENIDLCDRKKCLDKYVSINTHICRTIVEITSVFLYTAKK